VQNCTVKYGYARVSTDGQSVDAQVRTLRAAVRIMRQRRLRHRQAREQDVEFSLPLEANKATCLARVLRLSMHLH
jgi:hypothetical protein